MQNVYLLWKLSLHFRRSCFVFCCLKMFWWPESRRLKGRRAETNRDTEGRMITAASSSERSAASQRDGTDEEGDKTKETFKNMLLTDGAVNSPQMISGAQICVSSVCRVPFVSACLQFINRHDANSRISPLTPQSVLCSPCTGRSIHHVIHAGRHQPETPSAPFEKPFGCGCCWRARVSRHGWCQVKREGDVRLRTFML